MASSVLDALHKGRPLELSTGLYTENKRMHSKQTYNGRSYDSVATNYRPDHLAILAGQKGACSRNDGCGVLMNSGFSQECSCGKRRTKRVDNADVLPTPVMNFGSPTSTVGSPPDVRPAKVSNRRTSVSQAEVLPSPTMDF